MRKFLTAATASLFAGSFFLLHPLPCTAAAKNPYAGKILTPEGAVIGDISAEGVIRDSATGVKIGTISPNGTVKGQDDTILGTAPPGNRFAAYHFANTGTAAPADSNSFQGPVKDAQGKEIGTIAPSGTITDKNSGRAIGVISPQGIVTGLDGQIIGNVAQGDPLAAYTIAKTAFENSQNAAEDSLK